MSAIERPILFNGDMVRAILEGRKTQTRRPLFSNMLYQIGPSNMPEWELYVKSPYGRKGDLLWVRETWRPALSDIHECFAYRADRSYQCGKQMPEETGMTKWKPSIFMPRAACRILLEILDVRVERVQSISETDAIAEGVERDGDGWKCYGKCDIHKQGYHLRTSATASYMSLWDSINKSRNLGWNINPWVWVVEFKRVTL